MELHEYLALLPAEKSDVVLKLRNTISTNLPLGFQELISEKYIEYVVSHSIYPNGYHCTPKKPLPFICIAIQKNFIAIHHLGIYANPKLVDWFVNEYPKHSQEKLDMGKGCIRFKKIDKIPFELIAQLSSKISVNDWINNYEEAVLKR